MKLHHIIASSAIASVLLIGCSKDGPQAGKQAEEAAVQATQSVKLLGGMMTVRIPADLSLAMEQGGASVYGDNARSVTLVGGTSPGGDSASLLDQTVANLKNMDAAMKVVAKGDVKFGEHPAKTVEVSMKNNGVDVHMVMALGVIGDKLASIQVLGPQSKADDVRNSAKAIFDSVSINAK
ncbi:DcrB-related protein [Lysobacter sp. FW306-1B-D06B]|uniref:DcrB-related protein n=1 Tax=Lysobacter sp. FW306-1B-D06B TaxID=3140250 RepID=UPI0031401985